MAKRLTPEEKAAREIQKKLDREAARVAKRAAQQAQWAAEALAKRAVFDAGLTEQEREAIAAVLVPSGKCMDYNLGVEVPTYENEFIESLAMNLKKWGSLSPAQLAPIVRAHTRMLEATKLRAQWPAIAEGDEVAVLCKVLAIQERPNSGFGRSWKIKMRSHYGRIFHINTAAQRFLNVAEQALKEEMRVNVQGRAGWVSPDTRVVVLDKKQLYFQGL